MMVPWFQHAQLLYAALNKATAVPRAPIDRIEAVPGKILFSTKSKVLFWARTKTPAISYQYVDNPSGRPAPRGFLLDSEDDWECFKS